MAAVVAVPGGVKIRMLPVRAWVAHALWGGALKLLPQGSIWHYYHEGLLPETAALLAAFGGTQPKSP
jgi:hypothetical protein